VQYLQKFLTPESKFLYPALNTLLRVIEVHQATQIISSLSHAPKLQRTVIQATGILGNPVTVPWLIEKMATPELARLAGESFTYITGADLAELDLEGDWPENFEAGPTEDPKDENVAMDADEDLPWPDVDKIKTWWSQNQSRFRAGQRYLLGQLITIEHCQQVLHTGFQRQRQAAALELALRQPREPLFEVRAPAKRQQQLLAKLTGNHLTHASQ
jgi:uncharacterized protein (TIGR02270 family)